VRLWSLHPQYLDSKGLVALWREALLAQRVLQGETRGYTRHPQLLRFKEQPRPVAAIATYLLHIHREAVERGYHFDADKIAPGRSRKQMLVTDGQLAYEWQHLLGKLKLRDPQRYRELRSLQHPLPHPMILIVPGEVAAWEIR